YRARLELHSFPTRRSSDLRLGDRRITSAENYFSSAASSFSSAASAAFSSAAFLDAAARVARSASLEASSSVTREIWDIGALSPLDRKSTRLNSSHVSISYA